MRHSPDWKTTSEAVPYQNQGSPAIRDRPASMHMHSPAPVMTSPETAMSSHFDGCVRVSSMVTYLFPNLMMQG